ncbi:hypothetical protein MUN74_10015 [Agromyces endophyticus]|uniref:hypothetical protein n=1 Tax=Agromyces sp. H17E-10 TaxID=2932244 RepID=UPI001FD42803|nr:hypothetical protein [Agromyces sp. H17E-10]UOQ87649.1 hypothetical protein MUN74_10015 [Agromyces sp. H17E-10]
MSDDDAATADAGDEAPDDPHLLGPGLLPTPFTADEIRAASGTGKTIRLVVDLPDGTSFERVNRFTDLDDEGATLSQWRLGVDGGVDGPVTSERVTWLELQEHAAFPAEHTTRETEVLDLAFGRVECLRYEVRHEPEHPGVARFWFALEHPGMPVRYEVPTPTGVVRTSVVSIDVDD